MMRHIQMNEAEVDHITMNEGLRILCRIHILRVFYFIYLIWSGIAHLIRSCYS